MNSKHVWWTDEWVQFDQSIFDAATTSGVVVVQALLSVYLGHISSTNCDDFEPICYDNYP